MQKTKESENERVAVIPEGGFLPVGRQQFELLVVVAGIHVLDQMVSDNLTGSGVLSPAACKVVSIFESVGGILFVLFGIVTITAIICSVRKAIIPAMAGYLFFALIHLLVNMGSLLLTADSRRGQPLSELWDVVTIYFMGVSVFTSWYWFLDRAVPGGAFIFPSEHDRRSIIDYLFLSFNTSATFGPTTEVPTSQVVKILMMLQVSSSLLMLTVLLTRAVSKL